MKQHDNQTLMSLGLLLLRLAAGGMMLVSHGWGKLINFGTKAPLFPDPLGVGSMMSLSLAVFAEVFCSLAIILGIATRFAAIPLVITMFVAAFVVHADDPWHKTEFALLYLVPFLTLVFTGAGGFSLDALMKKRKN